MKSCFFVFMLMTSNLFGQTVQQTSNTNDFLNWLIQTDHIELLNTRSDISSFATIGDADALFLHSILVDSTNTSSKKRLKDFMTTDEIDIYHQGFKELREVKWRDTHYKLPVKYYTRTSYKLNGKMIFIKKTFYGLSLPLFLNKEQTRVLIGEYFTADIAFGEWYLILCENVNGKWHVVARVVTHSS